MQNTALNRHWRGPSTAACRVGATQNRVSERSRCRGMTGMAEADSILGSRGRELHVEQCSGCSGRGADAQGDSGDDDVRQRPTHRISKRAILGWRSFDGRLTRDVIAPLAEGVGCE